MPRQLTENMPWQAREIREMEINTEPDDIIIWRGSSNGDLSLKSEYEYYSDKGVAVQWEKQIWRTFLPSKISFLVWRILRRRISTSERLNRRGMQTGGVCLSSILGTLEDENHIFILCQNAQNLLCWLLQLIGENISRFMNISELIKWAAILPKKPMLSKHSSADLLRHLGSVVC